MPEYLAPGVYVEETSFRAKSIEGVGTSTTGFVGATRYGPLDGEPELITSFSQFERIYGGLDPLVYENVPVTNYLAHGVRAFFDNGGSRLYVARAFTASDLDATLARAPIPSPIAAIATVDATALGASNRVLNALDTSANALTQSQAAALIILQFAVEQTLAALVSVASPTLNYNYGAGEPTVGEQLQAWIAGLDEVDVPEKPTLEDAFDNLWQAIMDAADAQLQAAVAGQADVINTQSTIGNTYQAGINMGNNQALTGLSSNPTALTVAGTTASQAAVTVETAAANLATATATLSTSIVMVTDVATAQTAITHTTAVTTAAIAVITASTTAVDAIRTAARTARVEARLAIADADAQWVARFPGAAGNLSIRVTGRLGSSVLGGTSTEPTIRQVRDGDLVLIRQGDRALIHGVERRQGAWFFLPAVGDAFSLNELDEPGGDRVYPVQLTVEATLPGRFSQTMVWDNLTLSNLPQRQRDSLTAIFAPTEQISNRLQALETPIVLTVAGEVRPAQLVAQILHLEDWSAVLSENQLTQVQTYALSGGSDGEMPQPPAYEGMGDDNTPTKSGLRSLADLEEISIIAAPGYSYNWGDRSTQILTISQHLVSHCERLRYRVAVLDSPNDQAISGVRNYRAGLDTSHAALYYPWVRVLDPVSDQEINLPPSGFVAGIYARNDVQIGVHKAPANEVVRGAIGVEMLINKAQQDVLNPLGINCIRFFEGRGIRVWGARTASSDPEWKYLNIRRYFVFLEASIDRSTQWAVFEPNGERLWDNVRRTVEGFLENEWREGHLSGSKIEEAFFVRCDRSTMTQNDLDNGRMICLIGVAPLYPAEFVIFRIGQWTADRR